VGSVDSGTGAGEPATQKGNIMWVDERKTKNDENQALDVHVEGGRREKINRHQS
jgi:hypothetical protein